MTPKEFFERLQDELQSAVWEGTSNRIFGDAVFVVPEIPIANLSRWPRCCCFVKDEGTVFDEEHPNLMWQNATLTVALDNVQDALGSGAMVGANRTAGTSKGAGMLDLHYALSRVLMGVTALTSRVVLLEASSQPPNVVDGGNAPAVTKVFSISALVNTGGTTPSETEILHVPGFLYWNPSSLTAPVNYGTLLGYTKDGVSFAPSPEYFDVRTEETGETLYKRYYTGHHAKVSAILRNWNAGVLGAVFPGQSGTTYAQAPGSLVAGDEISSATYTKPLLFVPLVSSDPCLLVKKAVPSVSMAARLQWSHSKGLNILAEFDVLYNGTGAQTQYYIGPLSGASL